MTDRPRMKPAALEQVGCGSGLRVADLVTELAPFGADVRGSVQVAVSDVTQDSRKVRPGSLFVVRQGRKNDGLRFLEQALDRGASAVLCARQAALPQLDLPVVRVDDVKQALAFAAEAVHGHPSRALDVVAVTGTNGKTTVTFLLTAALEAMGLRPARLGTLGFEVNGQVEPTELTTPQADDLSRYAGRAVTERATHLVLEASSIALEEGRLAALHTACAAFTNLSQDHLDYHGDLSKYGEAKARLFLEPVVGRAAICIDGDFGRQLAERAEQAGTAVTRVSQGSEQKQADARADVRLVGIATRAASGDPPLRGLLEVGGERHELRSPLIGAHNRENLAVAAGVLTALRLEPFEAGLRGMSAAPPPPGRLEPCHDRGAEIRVFVDYAHTPDALERALRSLRELGPARLRCVFGCGGDRDRGKRPLMGKVAAELADEVWITNDNPRSEPPALIAEAIRRGAEGSTAPVQICLDRAQAIDRAILGAETGDIVLIAGKGHETYQLIAGQRLEFDDRAEARRALEARRRARGRV